MGEQLEGRGPSGPGIGPVFLGHQRQGLGHQEHSLGGGGVLCMGGHGMLLCMFP